MNQDASVAIAIRARDEAAATFQSVRRGLRDVGQGMESATVSGRAASGVFGGLARSLMGVAGLTLSAGAALVAVRTAMGDTAKATAQAEFVVAGFGPAAKVSLERAREAAEGLGRQYAATESEVVAAFTVLTRESNRSDISIRQLEGTLALARATGVSFSQAASIVAEGLKGNLEPMRQLTGDRGLKTLNEGMQRSISLAAQATTAFDRLGAAMRRMWERIPSNIARGLQPTPIGEDPLLRDILAIGGGAGGRRGGGGAGVAGVSPRTQAIQQAVINLNVQGNVIMNEDQRREFIREVQRLLDENARRGG